MNRGISTAGVLLGLVLGFPAGMAYAMAHRAWRDLRTTKGLVTGMRRTAWRLGGIAMVWAGLLAVLAFGAVAYAVGSTGPHRPTGCVTATARPSAAVASAAPRPDVQRSTPSPGPTCR